MEMKTEDTPVRCDGMEEDGAPFSLPYRHYARVVRREIRMRITLRRDGDIAPYRHYTRASRGAAQLLSHHHVAEIKQ